MRISMDSYKDDIRRAFRVLGTEIGFQQNALDIKEWRDIGLLTDDEAHELRKYNREIYSTLPIE